MCAKGALCPFSHEQQKVMELMMKEEEDSTPECWFWQQGMCTNREACPFRHVGDIPQNKKMIKGAVLGEPEDDNIYTAIKVALSPIAEMETAADVLKFRVRLTKYARDARSEMRLAGKPMERLVNEYTDGFFAKVFASIGDRPWIGEVDFHLMLDTAIKELLPENLVVSVPMEELEMHIFKAHDRGLDEQQSLPVVWQTVQQVLQGPKTRSKVYKACETGRKDTTDEELVYGADDFAKQWIANTMRRLRAETGGYPEGVLPEDMAVTLFTRLLEAETLPASRIAEGSAPEGGWKAWLEEVIPEAYKDPKANQEGE